MTVMTSRQMHTTRAGRRKGALLHFDGKAMTLTQWAEHLGISYACLYSRLREGMSLQLALTKNPPVHPRDRLQPVSKEVSDAFRSWLRSPAPPVAVE